MKEGRERRRGRGEFAPEGPIFFKKIWEEIDCQNALLAFVSSIFVLRLTFTFWGVEERESPSKPSSLVEHVIRAGWPKHVMHQE